MSENNPVFWSQRLLRQLCSTCSAWRGVIPKNFRLGIYLKLEERRLNPRHHVRKIVALSDIYSPQAVARAMDDAFTYEAFSSEYIANLLEQRARFTPEASALHLTRREDLLEVRLEPPDLSIYQANPHPEPHDT
jgi:hypothetical protein